MTSLNRLPCQLYSFLMTSALLFCISLTANAQTSVNDIAQRYDQLTQYTIRRNGKRVGKHTLAFDQLGETVTAKVESNIRIRILGITVYRLLYTAEEQWKSNSLVSATATTTENGESSTVSLLDIAVDERPSFASNHWHSGVLAAESVFNTLSGDTSHVSVVKVAEEALETGDGTVSATHYRYDGDIKADVWYDSDDLWVKLAFSGDDGSRITYLRD